MAAHEDQNPDVPAESESLLLKKIPIVLSAKPVLKKPKGITYRETQLQQLHRLALSSLVKAFDAEKSINPHKRNQIKERLMKEWKMTENDLCQQQQRDDDLPKFNTNTITETQPLETNVEEQQTTAVEKAAKRLMNSDVKSNEEKNMHSLEIENVDNVEEDGWILI